MAQAGLVSMVLVMAGASLLLFDVVVSRTAGLVTGAVVLVALVGLWLVVPHLVGRGGRPTG